MKTVAGVFRYPSSARDAAIALRQAGFAEDQVNLLYPNAPEEAIHSIATSQTEEPGVGGAIGGVLGAALGMSAGFELGVAVTALIPGVGPIFAVGVAAAALFGVGGGVTGAILGETADVETTDGVPADEIFFYEDALRQKKSVVIVLAKDRHEEKRAHEILAGAGAQSIDAAKKDWWLGLRDAQAEHYRSLGHDFEQDQDVYRTGFEAALRRECRGKSVESLPDCLKWWYPKVWDTEAFQQGYERGRAYWNEETAGHVPAVQSH
ncbi:MAG TPA: hypothetical protein VHW09_24815 [Bryobacteraceae bacterium]|jgi:hypothetical protein|nr:hypothetical protein [Bryobacteraceae bacterium]